ncbi:aldehyde dehydrogenase family protein [Micromonospora sagamiensis]|uniref:Aldehyde dehydrogenase (NAD+) n=1 Tax=Micromonospora sagamiensis TaxID=47875 RepID=A0A562WC98_9ACTN|nr:aldehyde dehydrogenase family protein [Micromonospora sagamiensis]TWJ27826.1 aldehyde dehydrogenase (NAD+) [Micromonospora sagamiensis]BCL13286.1 aldehyde dehydrogenase [Micromonospora sagamiensis]
MPVPYHLNLVDGEWVDGERRPNANPARPGEIVSEYARADRDTARAAIDAARRAQPGWARQPVGYRMEILDRIGSTILSRTEELAVLLAREEGKLLGEARGEVTRAGQTFRYYAHQLLQPQGEVYSSTRPRVQAEVRRRPLGVVGVITPWNYPLAIPAWKVAPALAYGNAVVLKPAELVTASAGELARIIAGSGVPPGVFNLVMGSGREVGEELLTSSGIDGISFTGGTGTGTHVARQCIAHGNKRFQLEMGGKNPLVVLDDADLDVAVRCALDGSFFSSGQRCTASSRLIVQAGIHDRFVEALAAAADALRVGDPLDPRSDLGPVVSPDQLAQNLDYVRIGRDEGATVVAGGAHRADEGQFMRPTLFAGARNDMRLAREEIFGPVSCVIRVDDLDEAIGVAGDTPYGLSAGIVTTSLSAAERFKQEARAGIVTVNLPTAGTELHLPFGGTGASNHGPREQGGYARDFYCVPVTCYTGW